MMGTKDGCIDRELYKQKAEKIGRHLKNRRKIAESHERDAKDAKAGQYCEGNETGENF